MTIGAEDLRKKFGGRLGVAIALVEGELAPHQVEFAAEAIGSPIILAAAESQIRLRLLREKAEPNPRLQEIAAESNRGQCGCCGAYTQGNCKGCGAKTGVPCEPNCRYEVERHRIGT